MVRALHQPPEADASRAAASHSDSSAASAKDSPNLLDLLTAAPSDPGHTNLQTTEVAQAELLGVLAGGVHSAVLLGVKERKATVRLRKRQEPLVVEIADFVESELIEEALRTKQRVLVESDGAKLEVVGMLQVSSPEELVLKARTIELNAAELVTVRSGRSGLRLRADGNVELVGSRISAASRGLMRIVGRALRLN